MTLYCKGKQLKAHKVILSACSSIFRNILKEAQSPHPVIVLWDVDPRDGSALLDFMYNGQVDIQQDDLERFLIVADRLQVRGLSGEEPTPEPGPQPDSRKRALEPLGQQAFNPAKVLRNDKSLVQSSSDHLVIHNHHPETREIRSPRLEIKTETDIKVEENNHRAHNNVACVTLPHRSPAHAHNSAVGPLKKRNLITDNNPHVINHRTESDTEYTPEEVDFPPVTNGDYPLEQAENYDEFYEDGDGGYNNSTTQYPIDYSMDSSPGKSSKSVKCPYCDKVLKYRHNLKGHIQNQHGAGEPEAPCPICPDKIFKNAASLRDHMSRKHRGEKTALATAAAQDKPAVSSKTGQS